MNPTKSRIYQLFFLFFIVSFAKAQIVNIPDANFKAKLISLGLDVNPTDGNIQQVEVSSIPILDVSNSNISDLTGIESFTNLVNLNCSNNLLTSLNVSSLVNLQYLIFPSNQVGTINVANLVNLISLQCNQNSLTALNLSGLVNLKFLNCSFNPITSLDLSTLVNLLQLSCFDCNLSSINLSGLSAITNISCSGNQLASLDVSALTSLQSLSLHGNLLTTINLSNLINLTFLRCGSPELNSIDFSGLINLNSLIIYNCNIPSFDFSNLTKLTTLEIQSCYNLTSIDVTNCELLTSIKTATCLLLNNVFMKNGGQFTNVDFGLDPIQYVCCNDIDFSLVNQAIIDTQEIPLGHANSYCSFVPGGDYNTITGTTRNDLDVNGCDPADQPFPFMKINYTDGTTNYSTFTEDDGKYNLYTNTGNFTITPALENPSFYNVSLPSATVNFSNNNNNTSVQDFCIVKNGDHPDVEVVVAPIYASVTNGVAKYQVAYKNKGTEVHSGSISLSYEDNFLNVGLINPVPTSQSTGNLLWNFSNLKSFESRSIEVSFDVTGANGENLTFATNITQNGVDENPNDNNFNYDETIVTAIDLISITCLQGENVDVASIGDYLHYMVNFENTTTTPIENVVVKMEIDPTMFDINSLQVINASNEVYARVKGNTAELICKNANLGGPGGHGNILLKIRSVGILTSESTVINNASVFFDYTAPVTTEDASTTFATLQTTIFNEDVSISIYPNPTNSIITIASETEIRSVQLYDVQGRLIQTTIGDKRAIDISDNEKGIYFLKVTTEKGSKVEKVVKE